eukprot:13470556-Ditylum_brightwellii.AAC.1
MGHPQPLTPIISDNSTTVGIANRTIKKQRSYAMEMQYFWLVDQVAQGNFDVQWCPGMENLGDYVTKYYAPAHHIKVCPLYLHTPTSPRYLPRTISPSVLQGCVVPAQKRMFGHNNGRQTNQGKDRILARSQAPTVLSQTPTAHMYTVYTCKAGMRAPTALVQMSWAVCGVSQPGHWKSLRHSHNLVTT